MCREPQDVTTEQIKMVKVKSNSFSPSYIYFDKSLAAVAFELLLSVWEKVCYANA